LILVQVEFSFLQLDLLEKQEIWAHKIQKQTLVQVILKERKSHITLGLKQKQWAVATYDFNVEFFESDIFKCASRLKNPIQKCYQYIHTLQSNGAHTVIAF